MTQSISKNISNLFKKKLDVVVGARKLKKGLIKD